MPISKCVRCEKLFDKVSHAVCPACLPAEEEDYEAVRNCLAENPEMNTEGVSELTGVSVQCVMRMVDEGFISSAISIGEVVCGKCGAPAISATKRLCHACLDKLNSNLAKQRSKLQVQQSKDVEIDAYRGGVREQIAAKRRGI